MKPIDTKKDIQNLSSLVAILKSNPNGLWMRELSRQTKIHPETIRRLMIKYPGILEPYADFTPYNIKLKILKLKNPDITPQLIAKYVNMKKR